MHLVRRFWRRDFGRKSRAQRALVLVLTLVGATLAAIATSAPASAAPTYVQGATDIGGNPSSSLNVAFPSNNAAGDLLVVEATFDSSSDSTFTCSDSQSNTYSSPYVINNATHGQSLGVCYAANSKSGANTVTVTMTTGNCCLETDIAEYSGIATSNPLDVETGQPGSGNTSADNVTSGAATTTTNGDLIFGAINDVQGLAGSISAGSGFTKRVNSVTNYTVAEDQTQTSAGSIAATATFGTSSDYVAIMMAFKPPPSSPGHPLTNVSVQPSDPTPSGASTWSVTASSLTGGTVKCLGVWVDTSSTFGSTSSSTTFTGNPGGTAFTAGTWNTGPTSVGSSSETKWTSTSGMTYASGSSKTFTLSTTNPAASVYFVQIETFSDTGCSTPIDNGVSAVAVTTNTVVSVTITPTFTFAVNGQANTTVCNGLPGASITSTSTAVTFGNLAAGARAFGVQQLRVTTNAGGGYVIYLHSTAASPNVMKGSASHAIADSGSVALPAAGNEFFGYTTDSTTAAVTSGNIKSVPQNNGNDVVGNGAAGTNDNNCVGFAAGTSATTPADAYASTIVYTAVPTF